MKVQSFPLCESMVTEQSPSGKEIVEGMEESSLSLRSASSEQLSIKSNVSSLFLEARETWASFTDERGNCSTN